MLIAVDDNDTAMKSSPETLGLERGPGASTLGWPCDVITARSYLEAVGILAAHREGVALESLTPVVNNPIRILPPVLEREVEAHLVDDDEPPPRIPLDVQVDEWTG